MSVTPRRHIKSLSALFAFEAAGRHRNFTTAARELGVTQAAVSKQIALLEEDLGRALFERLHREVRLTQAGRELFDVASSTLGTLSDTLARLRLADRSRPVTIGATLAMSHFWLLPRLPAFRTAHPDLQIRVVSQDEPLRMDDGSLDMVIRFGDGKWDDGASFRLFKSEIVPMASPGFLATRGSMTSVEDVLASPLIEYDAPDETWTDWNDWLSAAGKPIRAIKASLSFSRYADAIQAAAVDQGVILVWSGLTGGIEERGGLVRLPGPVLAPRGDFYLVVADPHGSQADEKSLITWLVQEAKAQGDTIGSGS